MYIVLGVLYESFIHPITILSTLPTAGVGALALWLAGSELDVIAIIGIILLIGIVKKNAIMMIDFALAAEREQGMPPREAIYRGLSAAFSADPDDTLAALLGALPLMLSTGVGAELRRPLGIGMVGGLMLSRGADPVHHPGDLSAVRPPVAAPEAPLPASGRGGVSEVFRPLHLPPGGDDPHLAGHHPVRHSRLPATAGGPAAAGGLPVIMVSASLPGASPETMASSVATPLERSLGADCRGQ